MGLMNWFVLLSLLAALPAFSQNGKSKDFIESFNKATNENVPGQDGIMYSFGFVDDGDPKIAVNFTPKKIMPVKNLSKLPQQLQTKLKINPDDGKEYYFVNYLEEANLTNSSGKEFKGLVSVSRMIRKNPKTNEVEFMYPNGDWHKVLSTTSTKLNENGALNQSAIDEKLTALADAGVKPADLATLLKDPELACKWVGVPKPIKVSTGKFEKKYFCRSQVECSGPFHLNGYDLEGGTYEVSCVNDKNDCSAFLPCMNYEEDDDFEKLKKSIPASSSHQ